MRGGSDIRASARVRLTALTIMILLLAAIAVLETVAFFNGLWRPCGIARVCAGIRRDGASPTMCAIHRCLFHEVFWRFARPRSDALPSEYGFQFQSREPRAKFSTQKEGETSDFGTSSSTKNALNPSGCGKTTLLNCFSGLDDLTGGQVKVGGVDVHKMPDGKKSEFRARYMGFISQTHNLLPVLTALESVELPLLVSRAKEANAKKEGLAALKLIDLADWQDHRPAELSGGQQQRVAIARALLQNALS